MALNQHLRLSMTQKKVCAAIQGKPKSMEELAAELAVSSGLVQNELKDLLKLELVEKQDGFPTRFLLKRDIAHALADRKALSEKDHFKLRLLCVIEVKAIEEELLKKELNTIRTALEKDKDFTVYDVKQAEFLLVDEYISSYLEVNLSVKNFLSLAKLLFYYGPVNIEVLKPATWEISADDLQDGLVEWSSMVHGYSNYIAQSMSRQELEKFHQNLYKKT